MTEGSDHDYISPRTVYIEVQHQFNGYDGKVHYSYTGGCAFSIGPQHLLTALHVVQPEPAFLEGLGHGQPCHQKILARDTEFVLSDGEAPETTDRWRNCSEEYRLITFLADLDVALLETDKIHFVTPLCVVPIKDNLRIFTFDLRNAYRMKIHSGYAWESEESNGTYFHSDAFVDKGFSGGPVTGTHLNTDSLANGCKINMRLLWA